MSNKNENLKVFSSKKTKVGKSSSSSSMKKLQWDALEELHQFVKKIKLLMFDRDDLTSWIS